MVIFFNVPAARNQLLNHGVVYTLRDHRIREGDNDAREGGYMNFRPLGKVYIRLWKEDVKGIDDIRDVAPQSGFSAEEWWGLARKEYDGKPLFLYQVALVQGSMESATTENMITQLDQFIRGG